MLFSKDKYTYIVTCASLVVLLIYCKENYDNPILNKYNKYTINEDIKTPNNILSNCSKLMRTVFPEKTKLINAAHDKLGRENQVYLLIEVKSEEVDELIKYSPFATALFRKDRIFVTETEIVKWWKVRNIKRYVSSCAHLQNGECVNILIDKDRDDKQYIFLEWSQM